MMKIIAATGCPVGVAHTFMAAQALEEAAQAAGVSIKVETHGQIGVENELSAQEIAEADVVIIAADKDVEAERFVGKPVIEVPVGKGISDAAGLISQAVEGKARIYSSSGPARKDAGEAVEPVVSRNQTWNAVYKVLMNGVSYMLPFVVAGGTLIAASLMWGVYSADADSDQYNAFAATLNQLGTLIMGMMVPVFAAYMAEAIGKRPAIMVGFAGGLVAVETGAGFIGGVIAGCIGGYSIVMLQKLFHKLPKSLDGLKAMFFLPFFGAAITGLIMYVLGTPISAVNTFMKDFLSSFADASPLILGVIVGCMIAFDLGGPVNKAAFVTGVALLSEGNITFMAGVSAAVMVPPLMTTFSTLVFRKYYDESERNAGLVNLVLGGTHISEGSIPFAAKDPFRIIPVMMLGSSIAASLSYLFGCGSPAPHGGFLVLPVITNPLGWTFAIVLGTVVGGLGIGLLRRHQVLRRRKA